MESERAGLARAAVESVKTPALGTWVRVIWRDAADERETWMRAEDIDEAGVEVRSVGYLVRVTKMYLTLAADVHEPAPTSEGGVATFGRVTRIPPGMVQSIKELK